ncbi:O-antigen ligase family protein [Novosphingobium sp. MW5]|nr:O-antigen ligase family protein [Novosphingobium sp. MW5]
MAIVLIASAFILGGGSRPDIASVPYLRALSALAFGFAAFSLNANRLRTYRILLWFASALVALPALQLLPLPPGLANGLGGHEIVAEIDSELQLGKLWRPLTMSPQWTLNALFALTVPLAALVLATNLSVNEHGKLALCICLLGALSGILAILQIQGPPQGPLYFYDITNNGSAVGLFANRNHQAIFLACLVPIGFALTVSRRGPFTDRALSSPNKAHQAFRSIEGWRTGLIMAVSAAFVTAMVIITGSRAGLLAIAIALLSTPFVTGSFGRDAKADGSKQSRMLIIALSLSAAGMLASLAVWLDHAVALDRLVASTPSDEMRLKILPVMREMIVAYWPWGSGAGTFQKVYQIYEPGSLLEPAYMNHAHNDWLEAIMTGGAIAALLLIAGVGGWLLAASRVLAAGSVDTFQPLRRAALVVVLMLAIASITDYPLRTPSVSVLFAICAVWLCVPFVRSSTEERLSRRTTDFAKQETTSK